MVVAGLRRRNRGWHLRLDPALEVVLGSAPQICASPLQQPGHYRPARLAFTLGYEALAERYGVRLVFDEITTIDPGAATVVTRSGRICYDR